MKVFSREFTLKEKILMLVLILALLGMAYYQFVDVPLRAQLTAAQAETESLNVELAAVEAKLEKMRRMRTELDAVIGTATEMGSYNNSKVELALLNGILANTDKYSISFANVTRSGDQIRRSFTLQFSAPDYNTVEKVIAELAQCHYRCLVSDMNCNISRHWVRYENMADRLEISYGVSLSATFYETMVGGVADSGLPESGAAA